MTRRSTRSTALVVIGLVLLACSGSDDPPSPTAAASTTEVGEAAGTDQTTSPSTSTAAVSASSTPSDTSPTVDDGSRPGVVARDGSVEDVLSEIPDAGHFAGLVAGWLAAVPGQEGVLRNARGITLFVPTDDAFSEADRDALLDDLDATARFIGEHLVVSVLTVADLPGTLVTAMGSEYAIDGSTIGGHTIVVADTPATNGVIHVLDGPLIAPR